MSPATTVPLNIPGLDVPLSLQVHGQRDKVISERLRREGVWEPYETHLVLNLLEPGGVFVDVGANLGYFSILAAACVGERGRVYAFEPDPDNFALLQANSETNGFGQRISSSRSCPRFNLPATVITCGSKSKKPAPIRTGWLRSWRAGPEFRSETWVMPV